MLRIFLPSFCFISYLSLRTEYNLSHTKAYFSSDPWNHLPNQSNHFVTVSNFEPWINCHIVHRNSCTFIFLHPTKTTLCLYTFKCIIIFHAYVNILIVYNRPSCIYITQYGETTLITEVLLSFTFKRFWIINVRSAAIGKISIVIIHPCIIVQMIIASIADIEYLCSTYSNDGWNSCYNGQWAS